VEILTALAGVVVTIIGCAISIAVYRWQATTAAATAYRPPIAETLAELAKGVDAHAVLNRREVAIESAVLLFRPALRGRRAARLDTAWSEFRRVRATIEPGGLAYLREQATGVRSDDPTLRLTAALHELLAVAS